MILLVRHNSDFFTVIGRLRIPTATNCPQDQVPANGTSERVSLNQSDDGDDLDMDTRETG